jgi:hypothetical protein
MGQGFRPAPRKIFQDVQKPANAPAFLSQVLGVRDELQREEDERLQKAREEQAREFQLKVAGFAYIRNAWNELVDIGAYFEFARTANRNETVYWLQECKPDDIELYIPVDSRWIEPTDKQWQVNFRSGLALGHKEAEVKWFWPPDVPRNWAVQFNSATPETSPRMLAQVLARLPLKYNLQGV